VLLLTTTCPGFKLDLNPLAQSRRPRALVARIFLDQPANDFITPNVQVPTRFHFAVRSVGTDLLDQHAFMYNNRRALKSRCGRRIGRRSVRQRAAVVLPWSWTYSTRRESRRPIRRWRNEPVSSVCIISSGSTLTPTSVQCTRSATDPLPGPRFVWTRSFAPGECSSPDGRAPIQDAGGSRPLCQLSSPLSVPDLTARAVRLESPTAHVYSRSRPVPP
jgi:hypothetical protein